MATAIATVEAGRDGNANGDRDGDVGSGRGWAFSETGTPVALASWHVLSRQTDGLKIVPKVE